MKCNDNNSNSNFIFVCRDGKFRIVKCLFNNGVNINLCDEEGESFFLVVCLEGYFKIM